MGDSVDIADLEGLGQLAKAPGVHLLHSGGQAGGQVAARQVDVLEGGAGVAMTGELGNGVDVPAGPGEVGQAKVPEGVGAETGYVDLERQGANDLGPRPERDGVGRI